MWQKIRQFFVKESIKESAGPRARILVVDDDQTTCALIRSVLSKKGFEVFTALNGQDGIDSARTHRPDLIFLDCLLPDINGLEVGKKLKQNETTRDIPIYFLTGVDTPKNIIDAYDLGAENYLVKPISPRELVSQVEESLRERF